MLFARSGASKAIGKPTRVLGNNLDITERKLAAELGGQVDLAFELDGMNCRIAVPVAQQ